MVRSLAKKIFDNGGFAEQSNRSEYPIKVPSGTYAFRAYKNFAGQENHGVVLRLNGSTNDKFSIIVRDNLVDETFTKFSCVMHGHVVIPTVRY